MRRTIVKTQFSYHRFATSISLLGEPHHARFSPCRNLERAAWSHRLKALLEIDEERARDSAIDDAVVERETDVHHGTDRDRIVIDHHRPLDDRFHGNDSGLTAVEYRGGEQRAVGAGIV